MTEGELYEKNHKKMAWTSHLVPFNSGILGGITWRSVSPYELYQQRLFRKRHLSHSRTRYRRRPFLSHPAGRGGDPFGDPDLLSCGETEGKKE